MGYLSNIKKQFLITFFNSLIPAYVIERLFWEQRGMGVQMVVYCEIIYALTVTVLEIPSGILSDKFGRKKLLVINNLLAAAELTILLFASSFWHFAFAVLLAGVGKAFSSGSENALLYDSLLSRGRQGDFEKLLGRLSVTDFAGSLIAALSGSLLAGFFGFELNYMISIVSMLAAFAIALTLKEPVMQTKPESGFGAMQYAKQAVLSFKAQPLMFIYCLTGAVLGACVIYLDEFWQLLLEGVGIPVLYFGVFSALSMLLRIPGSLFAYRLKERFRYKHIFVIIIIVSVIGYAAIFFTGNYLCLIPMLLLITLTGIVDPLVSGYLHHHTDSAIRATVESFSSLGLRLISIAVGLLFAYVSAAYSIFAGFLVLSVVCLVYLLFFKISLTPVQEDSVNR